MPDTVTWITHAFSVHQQGDNWNEVPGLYIFTGRNAAGQWVALYVGQADSLAGRIPNHERWEEALRHGATHVHAKVVRETVARDLIERELCRTLQPRLNVQLR